MENLDTSLPPKSKMGKWRVLTLRAASSLIWGGIGGLLFHFILSKIVALLACELACVASVSNRVIERNKVGARANKMEGKGEGREQNGCLQTSRF